MRYIYLALFGIVLLVANLSLEVSAQPAISKVKDVLIPMYDVNLSGFVGERLNNAYENRILAQDVDRLVDPFKVRTEDKCWQSEFWGKWFTSAVLAYRYHPTDKLKAKLTSAVSKLIATQTPDGYIGNYAPGKELQQWDIWGRKYCMLGLIAWYDVTGDAKSLLAASASADYLIRELKEKKVKITMLGNHRGMAATSILEPITQLYVRTGKKTYLDFAEEIVDQWETVGPHLISKSKVNVAERFPIPVKSWWGYEQGQKAYEMMSCYEGLLELYRITGKLLYKKAVEDVWNNIKETEINIAGSGSSMECWFGGKKLQPFVAKHYQETCVTATWIKLSQQLLRLTGEAKYADAIEISFYNALLGSMKPDGSTWAKYSPIIGIRSEGGEQCDMGLNCCVASGPRALYTFPASAVMKSVKGIAINFYNSGRYKINLATGKEIELVQKTDYPANGMVNIHFNILPKEKFEIKLRIPSWSEKTTVRINGKEIPGIKKGEYLAIERIWQKDDTIMLSFDMRGRIETIRAIENHEAVMMGPIVLTRDMRLTGAIDIDESITPQTDKDGFAIVKQVPAADGTWMNFEIPCLAGSFRAQESAKPVALLFCDYQSAGNTFSQDSRFRTWFPQLIDAEKKVMLPSGF